MKNTAILVNLFADQAFDFYFDTFTHDDRPTEDTKDYEKAKMAMIERFSLKKPHAIVMKYAVNLRYHEGDAKEFIEKADCL